MVFSFTTHYILEVDGTIKEQCREELTKKKKTLEKLKFYKKLLSITRNLEKSLKP